MKKFALKQWYPSLYDDIEAGTIVDYEDGWIYYTNKRGNKTTMEIDEEELFHKDFWELIEEKYCDCNIPIFTLNSTFCMKCLKDIEEKKPLFITEDGVECFDKDEYISIGVYYNKIYMIAYNYDAPYSSDVKRFKHESNADEYIWKNKPLLSVKDVVDNCVNLSYAENIELIELAKERSKE